MTGTPGSYHVHPKTDFSSSNHTFKGSLVRHKTIEKAFCFLAKPISIMWRKTHAHRLHRLLKLPFGIIYGMNMNLPITDVLDYSFWEALRTDPVIPTGVKQT